MSHKTSAILLVLTALGSPAVIPAQNGAKRNEELPAGVIMQKATTACLECHEARIIVQQRLSKAVWTKEVDKMVKWGAVMDANDRNALIDYLSANFGPGQPEYSAPRSAQEKTTVRSTRQKSK
jgi:hypothetical protein